MSSATEMRPRERQRERDREKREIEARDERGRKRQRNRDGRGPGLHTTRRCARHSIWVIRGGYRSTSLMRNCLALGLCSSPTPRSPRSF